MRCISWWSRVIWWLKGRPRGADQVLWLPIKHSTLLFWRGDQIAWLERKWENWSCGYWDYNGRIRWRIEEKAAAKKRMPDKLPDGIIGYPACRGSVNLAVNKEAASPPAHGNYDFCICCANKKFSFHIIQDLNCPKIWDSSNLVRCLIRRQWPYRT